MQRTTKEKFKFKPTATVKSYKLSSKPSFFLKTKSTMIGKEKEISNEKIIDKGIKKKKEESQKKEEVIKSQILADSYQDMNQFISLRKEKDNLENEEAKLKQSIENLKKREMNLKEKLEEKREFNKKQSEKIAGLKSDKEKIQKKLEDLKKKFEELSTHDNDDNETNNNVSSNEGDNEREPNLGELFSRLQILAEIAKEDEEENSRGLSPEDFNKLPITTFKDRMSDIKCVLCNFELCYNDEIIILPKCSHKFHKACLANYANRNDSCPTCNQKII